MMGGLRLLRLNLVELVESLDLSCEDLLSVYEAALPLHDDSQFDAFTKQVRAHLCGRKWHYRQNNCHRDTIFVFERALNLGFDIDCADFDVREGFFHQLRFCEAPLRDGGRREHAPKGGQDPMADHYQVRTDYLVHWSIKNCFPHTAVFLLKQRPVKCTFGYAPSWKNRSVGKSIYTLVLEQDEMSHQQKNLLIKEIDNAMKDSCLDLRGIEK